MASVSVPLLTVAIAPKFIFSVSSRQYLGFHGYAILSPEHTEEYQLFSALGFPPCSQSLLYKAGFIKHYRYHT